MGSGDWFRSIIGQKKRKGDRNKKVHSTAETSNGSKGSANAEIDQSSHLANGSSQQNGHNVRMLTEHVAAARIQMAFRSYMARKALRRLKGAVRFNVLVQGQETQKQSLSTLRCIHQWSNIQAQIRARRHDMVTQGRIKQKKLENQLKLEAKLQELEVEWSGSSETMEEILAKIQQREEAAIKRERAMAYAFSHQWRANPTLYLGQAYYSLGKENWGWSWRERWIAARPWEIRVHPQPHNPKKCHSGQVSKSEVKTPISTKPVLSNGKGTTKAKRIA